jgi:hypothetical protein
MSSCVAALPGERLTPTESRSVLSEYAKDPRVRIEFNERNSGSPFKPWNKGVRLVGGGYLWIADRTTMWTSGCWSGSSGNTMREG